MNSGLDKSSKAPNATTNGDKVADIDANESDDEDDEIEEVADVGTGTGRSL